MVCYLFDIMGKNLPRTDTEMYTEFTRHTLLRTLARSGNEVNLLDPIDNLPSEEKKVFLNICKLGFEKTVSSKQVLHSREISSFFGDVASGNESLGLITVDRMASRCGFENLYTFLHLTFQEYLAAFYISILDEELQLKIISEYSKKNHMLVVWKFYCGLINFSGQEKKFKSLEDDLFNVQCAFESQQQITCHNVTKSGDSGSLTFHNHFLTPTDFTAIGYVIANSVSCPVEKLVLDRCKLRHEGVHAFLKEAGDKILSIKTLCYHSKDCLMDQCNLLNSCLRNMASLELIFLVAFWEVAGSSVSLKM